MLSVICIGLEEHDLSVILKIKWFLLFPEHKRPWTGCLLCFVILTVIHFAMIHFSHIAIRGWIPFDWWLQLQLKGISWLNSVPGIHFWPAGNKGDKANLHPHFICSINSFSRKPKWSLQYFSLTIQNSKLKQVPDEI